MKKVEDAVIVKNEPCAENIYDMVLKAPYIAEKAQAGQFVEIYVENGINLLPRPISICEINKENGTIRLMYQVVGEGTKIFSQLKDRQNIKIMGPLGNGFKIYRSYNNVFIGGGIGVPPLLETVKAFKGVKNVILGFKNKDCVILEDDFKKLGAEVFIATDDGSYGFKGNAIELMESLNLNIDVISSCGPKIMLKSVCEFAQKRDITCQISMEERMACGIGACVGCVVKIKECHSDKWSYKKVCTDGPVFDSCEVIWE